MCAYVQVMCLQFVYVCVLVVHVYVAKKIDLFCALPFRRLLLCVLYYLIVEFEHFQSGFLHPVSCTERAICASFI